MNAQFILLAILLVVVLLPYQWISKQGGATRRPG